MHGLSRLLLVCVVLAIAAGGAYIALSDIPAPLATVEKVIPDDRLPR